MWFCSNLFHRRCCKPASQHTGLEVLVHEVIAAISTSPCPRSTRPDARRPNADHIRCWPIVHHSLSGFGGCSYADKTCWPQLDPGAADLSPPPDVAAQESNVEAAGEALRQFRVRFAVAVSVASNSRHSV